MRLACLRMIAGAAAAPLDTIRPAFANTARTLCTARQARVFSLPTSPSRLPAAGLLAPASRSTRLVTTTTQPPSRAGPRLQRCCCTAAMTSALDSSQHMQSQQQQQQQSAVEPAAAAAAAAMLPTLQRQVSKQPQLQQHNTQLLPVDPATLPVVSAPDAAAAASILTAPAAPNLDRSSCPHLYYIWPPQQQQQQQQPDQPPPASQGALQQAAELLRAGQPVAIPTETVYGLAANALSGAAVAGVFAAKGRPSDNPLIVHVSDLDMLAQLYPQPQQQQAGQQQGHAATNGTQPGSSASNPSSSSSSSRQDSLWFIPEQYHRLIAAFWPGPLTLLLPASPLIPAAVTAGLPTVAVRMPAHPVARALIAAAGVPLAAPSANTSGRPSPTTAQHVMEDLAGRVAAVVDGGACECGVESTVLDGLRSPPVVLRPGGVTPELLGLCPDMQGLQVYQRDFTDSQLEATPTTPGMKYRHYSPTAPLLLVDPTAAWRQAQQQQQQQQQQQGHGSLQQLVVQATQQLLQDLWEAPQQQPVAEGQRVVLLSTCSSSSCAVGWTEASLQRMQAPQHDTATQAGQLTKCNGSAGPSTPCHKVKSSSSSSQEGLEVLEYVLGSWQQPELVAQQVFAALRAADAVGPALIIAQGLPPEGPALAIMNRLHKAASQHVHVQVQPGQDAAV